MSHFIDRRVNRYHVSEEVFFRAFTCELSHSTHLAQTRYHLLMSQTNCALVLLKNGDLPFTLVPHELPHVTSLPPLHSFFWSGWEEGGGGFFFFFYEWENTNDTVEMLLTLVSQLLSV